ncbi:hypothetical protein C9439_02945 [archaeon SCG-AAA382B04]|nr:hypothetical protein C9439_02945 [archaeon SCG-AAA382B04]
MMMDGTMMGGGIWIWWILIPLLIIVMFLAFMGKEEKETTGDRALKILREKYAEGEITKEEFEEKKRKLL